ncbi:MAG: alpha-E domain-containing protein [Cytophagales bacterium]|nr:alpha-E domain-containing protein [Armatimonadota bacterium]
MLSREADSLFWMGRYLERAEATARIVDVQYHAALESPLANRDPQSLWNSILEISGDDLIFQARYGDVSERDLIQFMVFDIDQPDSVVSCVRAARANAQGVREVLSSEMWEVVNRAFLELLNWDVDKMLTTSPHQFLVDVRNRCHLFYGLAERTMLIGDASYFLKAGMFLERADQMSRLTDVLVRELTGGDYLLEEGEHFDTHGWIACLKSASAFEAFRKTYRGGITPDNVLSFLVLDWDYPSSIHHAVSQVERCLRSVSGSAGRRYASDAERLAGRLHADLSFLTIAEIRAQGLHEFLEGIQKRCFDIGNAVTDKYLRH